MKLWRLLRSRDWAVGLAPKELAGQREGLIFMIICLIAVALVTTADLVAPAHTTVGAIVFLPVAAAAWLLSQRLALVVVAVAMAMQWLPVVAGVSQPLTAGTRFLMIPVLALLAHVAATGTIRAREREIDARQARAAEEKAIELEHAKSEFLRLASHELRGPVAILRGYLSMVDEGTLGEVPPGVARVLPILTATASGMNQIVDQMLDTARLEDSRLQLQVAEVDLAAIVHESTSTVRLLHAGSHAVSVKGVDKPLMVRCDAARISTILGNLVSNALKYSFPGSEVSVKLTRKDGFATIAVSDCGIGIDESDLPRLFTRFGRIDSPSTADVPGTGLGLYLSRELARLHGGDISVESRPGEGSTFTLSLPLGKPRAAPAAESERARRRPQMAG